jgi:hypothetical protein
MTISDSTRLRPAKALPGRKLAGEQVLVDAQRRRVHVMNGVGGVVWAGIERAASVGEIVDEIVARYRVDAPTARGDVDRFVRELVEAGLVEVVAA